MDAEVGDRQQDKRLSPESGSAEFLRLTVNSKSRPYPGQSVRHHPTQRQKWTLEGIYFHLSPDTETQSAQHQVWS